MVGGPDFEEQPFNLATQGHRQPGSSIKPFILVEALEQGVSASDVYESAPQIFSFGKKGREKFPVANYEDQYYGSASVAAATTVSDNSIFAQLGLESLENGTRDIAATAHRMGVWTPLSTNPAMVLGGLEQGVTPLEWTYAFSTLARNGNKVWGCLSPEAGRPVSFTKVVSEEDGDPIKDSGCPGTEAENDPVYDQVIDDEVAAEAKGILHTVVTSGTGTNADIGEPEQWGKTGTTENNGDAWFCGALEEVTACVWVGYADSNTSMEYLYNGGPVDGGTFPALIWASVMNAWEEIAAIREANSEDSDETVSESSGSSGSAYSAPAPEDSGGDDSEAAPAEPTEPAAPTESAAPTPAPAPPAGGGSSGGTGGAAPAP
jgi:penicillin-binding protein 1A